MQKPPITKSEPDEHGHWGKFGGRYVPETLVAPLDELTNEFTRAREDPNFWDELNRLLRDYCGRPTPLFHARRLTEHAGGAQIYLKREDLLHTGAHKINNAVGQALLASRMGKRRVIAETGAGQHGVATATVCALFGLRCVIYMGAEDVRRQALNVFRMRLLGAEVITVNAGTRTLKDAINEALRDWVTNVQETYYLLGSALGPHPYPLMVREFQSVIGREAREQILSVTGKLPRALVACVGGGSNAIGLFHPFIADSGVRLIGVEAGGRGDSLGEHASRFHSGTSSGGGQVGVLQVLCRMCFRTRAARLQPLIRFQPASITRRSGRNMPSFMTLVEPSTSMQATPRRSKDFNSAPNRRESFPRWKRHTLSCLRFASRASCHRMTLSSSICLAAETKMSNSLQICIRNESDTRDVRPPQAFQMRRVHPVYHGRRSGFANYRASPG